MLSTGMCTGGMWGLASAKVGACLPTLGHVTRDRAPGQACDPRGAVQPAPLSAHDFTGAPCRAVWGPAQDKSAATDTCALCTPRESRERGAGRAASCCPLSPPVGLGLAIQGERCSGGAPRNFEQGLRVRTPHLLPSPAGVVCSPPARRGRPGRVKAPSPEQPAKKACGRNFLSPLPSPSWTPEGYEGEGGKKGREGGKRGG